MPTFEHSFTVTAPVEVVRRFHASTDAIPWLTPPPMVARVHRGGRVEEGMVAEFTLWLGPLPLRWCARHVDVGERSFVDEQAEGPFASWRHRHTIEAQGEHTTRVDDTVHYEHHPGVRGLVTRAMTSKLSLEGLFAYRAAMTRLCCRLGLGPAKSSETVEPRFVKGPHGSSSALH